MTGKINSFPSSEFALLGFLFAGPCHGYELHKRITATEGVGMIWGLKLSNMYAQLEKLEHKGLILGKMYPNDQRPARMEYSLTESGKNLFNEWMFQLVKHPRDFRHEFMVRIFFLSQYYPNRLAEVITKQLAECEQWVRTTQDKQNALSTSGTFQNIVYQFRISQIHSMVDWLKWLDAQTPKLQKHNED